MVPREVFQEIIHNGDGMRDWGSKGISPQRFFEVATLAINEPLLELFEIVGVGHEGLREYAGISAGFILAAGWSAWRVGRQA